MFSWTDLGIVIGVVGCVTGGLYLLKRWIPPDRRERHNEVAGYIFAAIGVLYAVLMAFVIIALWGPTTTPSRRPTVRRTTWLPSTGCPARCRWPRAVRWSGLRWPTPRR